MALALAPAAGHAGPPAPTPSSTSKATAAPAATPTAAPAATASAAPGPANPLAAARALLTLGDAFLQKRQWKRAHEALREAWALKQHWQIATLLGRAELELGQLQSAIEHLSFAAAAPDWKPPPYPDQIVTLLAEATARLPYVRFEGLPPGASVSVDGTTLGTTPFADPVAVDPGEHTFTVKQGAQTASRSVHVPARTPASPDAVVPVVFKWPPEVKATSPEPSFFGSRPFLTPAIVLGGSAVAGGVAGGVLFSLAERQRTIAERQREQYDALPESQKTDVNKKTVGDLLRREDALRTGALVSWIGAGLLAGAGLTLFLVKRSPPADAPAAAARLSLSWSPVAGPQGAGFVMSGSF